VLEARAVNDIHHPGLVDIFSFGQLTDGRPYYVMEFLDGRSLGAMLRVHRRLTPFDTYPVFNGRGAGAGGPCTTTVSFIAISSPTTSS